MARSKIFPEKKQVGLPSGTLDRINRALLSDEDASAFIRTAIERELDLRSKFSEKFDNATAINDEIRKIILEDEDIIHKLSDLIYRKFISK